MESLPLPPMIQDPAINRGRPTSAWDLDCARKGGVLGSSEHVVPAETPGSWQVLTSEELHAQALRRACRPLRFTLTKARTIKSAYWNGEKTIVDLAKENDCTTVTISRLVHGRTYWYA